MPSPRYPKKSFGSYLIPFILIFALIGTGWYIIQNKINLLDIRKIFDPPSIAKDEKVNIAFQEGENQIKPWSTEEWKTLASDEFLQVGDTLKTGPTGIIVLRFFEESEIRMDKKTEIKLIRLDKNEVSGDHVAVELISGQLWRRGKDANTSEADFIVTTQHQIVQMNKAAVINIKTDPDTLQVIGGKAISNIAEKIGGSRKPISQLELASGQEVVLDSLVIDQLKSGEKDVIVSISSEFSSSEWYLWNIEKEERLGNVVEISAATTGTAPATLEQLDEGLVAVTSPKQDQKTGKKVLVAGTYDQEKIEAVFVNTVSALLSREGDWEAPITLSEGQEKVTVTAQEIGSDTQKNVTEFSLDVDATGPALGKITQPEIDANNNGMIIGDTLELVGEVDTDAQKVCVMHNDKEPSYCLKQFKAGDKAYRYLGGVSYGNVVKGQNKYTITAYDTLGNVSQKTIYLFKDVPKPDTAIEESTSSTSTEPSTPTAELGKPSITSPDASSVYETSTSPLTISGTVDPKSRTLLINDKKGSYDAGSPSFQVEVDLTLGQNIIKIQTMDANGNKSKSALLTVMFVDKATEEPEATTTP